MWKQKCKIEEKDMFCELMRLLHKHQTSFSFHGSVENSDLVSCYVLLIHESNSNILGGGTCSSGDGGVYFLWERL